MAAMLTDILIIFLLAGGTAFAYVVNGRVKRLMLLLRELEPVVHQFALAVDKSEASVSHMQQSILKSLTDQEDSGGHDQAPQFSTSRAPSDVREIGVQAIRNKQELVRQFFELPRGERRI